MMRNQNAKWVVALKQQSATNGATLTSDVIDTQFFDAAEIIVHATTSNDATNNPATLRLLESDDTVATNFAAVTGFVGDTSFTIPASPTATTTAPFALFQVDTKTRKRYLKVDVSPITTQTFSVVARLTRAEQLQNGTTQQNVAVIVTG